MKQSAILTQRYSFFKLIQKVLFRQRMPLDKFEPIGLRFTDVQPNNKEIIAFKAMFSCDELPVSYMFIVAFRYLGQLLITSKIPSKLMGMIHISSRYQIMQPHNWLAPTDIEVRIEKCSENEKGITYLLQTYFYQLGQVTLINENQFLDKNLAYRNDKVIKGNILPNVKELTRKTFTASTAREYARVSGDFNPIHLHPWLAKLLGMKSSVIHGMYGVHWLLTQQSARELADKTVINVQFNRPCYLPTQVLLTKYCEEEGYALFSDSLKDRFVKLNFA
ncbi:MaoC family dehydratase [Thalassotalea piscium]